MAIERVMIGRETTRQTVPTLSGAFMFSIPAGGAGLFSYIVESSSDLETCK